MVDLIIASTAASFFWQTFECRTVECPSQLIMVCVKLSYDSLGLAFPGLEFLQNLHERVYHAALEKILHLGLQSQNHQQKLFWTASPHTKLKSWKKSTLTVSRIIHSNT